MQSICMRTGCAIAAFMACSLANAQSRALPHRGGDSQRWSAPRSYRLAEFAEGLYAPQGQAILEIVGDSINATNSTMGMQVGYRDQLEIPFNGWVVHADSGNSEIGYTNAQGPMAINAIRIPGDLFANGLRAISPVRAREAVWSGNVTQGGTLSDSYLLNFRLAGMKLGNPFNSGSIVDARLIMFEGSTQVGGFEVGGMRGGSTITTGPYSRPGVISNSIVWIDRTLGSGGGDPGIRLRSDASTAESAPGANTLIHLGTRMRARTNAGVQMQFLSHGGWTTVDHLDPARFTDEALRQYYAATGAPTHIMLWLGQNQTVAESADFYSLSYLLFKTHIDAIIDRHERVITDMGAPPPRWLLVSQYKTGYDQFHHELMCAGLHASSLERENVSFLNLYRLAGGEAFNQDAYLEDGVHPNGSGVHYLAFLMNEEMKSPVTCIADFDESGFVDLDDYSRFVAVFEAGEDLADIDGSGFVDIEDFSYFVAHFEDGC